MIEPTTPDEDEAFNEIERLSRVAQEMVRTAQDRDKLRKDKEDRAYKSGWNSALELAAYEIDNNFTKAFGKDTLSSIAIYIREMKK